MLLELDKTNENRLNFKVLPYKDIREEFGYNEKDLEDLLKTLIGDAIFPEFLVFGNERRRQAEPDIFAVDAYGNLVLFELKVSGKDDSGKIYQALRYAHAFSHWRYYDMNVHYKKCQPENSGEELMDLFEKHFGRKLDEAHFNQKQLIIVVSNQSDISVVNVTKYWRSQGVRIREYFYRFYKIGEKTIMEVSSDIHAQQYGSHCWINTCRSYYENAYLDMIKNSKAAAYGDRRSIIGPSLNKKRVFLYHNGYGIIAAGHGTAKVEPDQPCSFSKDELENTIELVDLIHGVDLATGRIDQYVSPQTMRELLQQDFFFATSISYLSDKNADTLYKKCEEVFGKTQ